MAELATGIGEIKNEFVAERTARIGEIENEFVAERAAGIEIIGNESMVRPLNQLRFGSNIRYQLGINNRNLTGTSSNHNNRKPGAAANIAQSRPEERTRIVRNDCSETKSTSIQRFVAILRCNEKISRESRTGSHLKIPYSFYSILFL